MICFAMPCYKSDPNVATRWATTLATELGVKATVSIVFNCAWIDTARAILVSNFLRTRCDYLFFRDQDIDIHPGVLLRMLNRLMLSQSDIIVAPYHVREEVPIRWDTGWDKQGKLVHAGLGCCLIQRHVIEDLWSRYHDELDFMQDGAECVDLFRKIFGPRNAGGERDLLKEDHSFFWRIRQNPTNRLGWLDYVRVTHDGVESHFISRDTTCGGANKENQT